MPDGGQLTADILKTEKSETLKPETLKPERLTGEISKSNTEMLKLKRQMLTG